MITKGEFDDRVGSDGEAPDDTGGPTDYYKLPSELLDAALLPVETRFVLKPLAVHSRVVLADPSLSSPVDGAYQVALAHAEKRLPMRAARLRDLHRRMEAARQRFLDVQKRQEAMRIDRNRYANYVNTQINEELGERRIEWNERRTALLDELAQLERDLLETEKAHYTELATAEDAMLQARLTSASRLSAALRLTEEAVREAEQQALVRCEPLITAAEDHRADLRRGAALQLEDFEARQERLLRDAETALDGEAAVRADLLHASHRATQAKREVSERAVAEVRHRLTEVAARAGLLPGEEANCRSAIQALVSQETVGHSLEGDHPASEEGSARYKGACRLLALAACGSIFGLSLGLLTGLLRSVSSVPHKLPETGIVCFLGIAAFWLIGELVHRMAVMASEAFHARNNDFDLARRRQFWFWVVPLVLAGVLSFVLIGIEATVEKFGIVGAMRAHTFQFQTGQATSQPPPDWAFWFIALIAAAPFVLFHACEGWAEVRHRMARRRMDGLVAKSIDDRMASPEMEALSAAIGDVQEAERLLAACTANGRTPEVLEAERRLEEVRQRRASMPELLRLSEVRSDKPQLLEAHLGVQHADAMARAARAAIENDPAVIAHRRQLEVFGGERPEDPEVVEAERQVAIRRARVEGDPQIVSLRARTQQAISQLADLDREAAEEMTRLNGRRKSISLSPGSYTKSVLQDAREDWVAAQILFDREYHRTLRLLESPRYLRWFEALRLYFTRDHSESLAYSGPSTEKSLIRKLAYGTVGAGAIVAFVLVAMQKFLR